MGITFGPAKNTRNIKERGLSFERAASFDSKRRFISKRSIMATTRFVGRRLEGDWKAIGYLDGRLHALVFTYRGNDIRIISFRRASKR